MINLSRWLHRPIRPTLDSGVRRVSYTANGSYQVGSRNGRVSPYNIIRKTIVVLVEFFLNYYESTNKGPVWPWTAKPCCTDDNGHNVVFSSFRTTSWTSQYYARRQKGNNEWRVPRRRRRPRAAVHKRFCRFRRFYCNAIMFFLFTFKDIIRTQTRCGYCARRVEYHDIICRKGFCE